MYWWLDFDLRVLRSNLFEHPLPKVMAKRHRVGFIAHAHTLEIAGLRIFKGVADDALHALARIQIFLHCDFVGRSLLEIPAHSNVKALGVLAKDHEMDVLLGAIFQRRETLVEKNAGAGVDVEVQLKTQAQQNIGCMDVCRDARIPHGAEQDSVEIAMEHFHRVGGQGSAIAKIALGAPVKLGQRNFAPSRDGSRF